jgi:hypothetical protein
MLKIAPPPGSAVTARMAPRMPNRAATFGDEPPPKESNPVEYLGAVPSTFSVRRVSRQWSPSMARVTVTGSQEAVPAISWSELDSLDPRTSVGQKEIAERIRHSLPDCEILFLTSAGDHPIQDVFPASGPGSRFHDWAAVLSALSRRADGRLFSIVSRISPNGAGDLEDLSVVDPTEPRACLVHIATRQGDDLRVYRRFLQPMHRRQLD